MKALLSDAIEDFERFRRSQDIAAGTLRAHRGILTKFLTVVGNIYCDKITEDHVTRHFEQAQKTKQPQSLRNDHQALSVFFQWCRHTKRMPMDANPLFGRRMPANAKRERERVNRSEFPALLDAADARCPRDRALVAVILYTLLRDREAADLRVRDVDLEAGYLTARISKKGGAIFEDRMPISAELDYELRRWLTAYTAEVGPLHPNDFLLPSRQIMPKFGTGGRIVGAETFRLKPDKPVGAAATIVRPILGSIGFPIVGRDGKHSGEGGHTIRRSGARALFDRLVEDHYDGALRVVQAQLHHETLVMTERYIGITADRRSRDELIRGKKMYGDDSANVTRLRRDA